MTRQWDVDTGDYAGDIGAVVSVSGHFAHAGDFYIPTDANTNYSINITSVTYTRREHYTYLTGTGKCSALVMYYG